MQNVQSQNINDIFFKGIYKDVWRKLVPEGLTEAEVDFIEEVANLKKGNCVLDFMCGYGRHVTELAKRGYLLTAIDNSTDYIQEIQTVAAAQNLSIKTLNSSALDMQLTDEYDAAICMGNSFAFFGEEDAIPILQNVSAHLKKDGVFILNTWMLGEIAIKHFREKDWFYLDEYKYLMDNQFFLHPSRIETDHIIIREDGLTETMKGIDYIFTIAEMQKLLKNAGLELVEIYSTPRKRKFKFGDTRAYLVAVKR